MPDLTFLYTEIGRGHPFYLDGIVTCLENDVSKSFTTEITDVYRASRLLSRQAWRAVRWLYRHGASPGLRSSLYGRLRTDRDYNRPSLALKVLGSSLRRRFERSGSALVVAHPMLVAILKERPRLYYQHGEVVTPGEAVVRGASWVFVPTAEAAGPFVAAGYAPDRVRITGLCIEPVLAARARDAFHRRLNRLGGTTPLTGAFFSSGAEPVHHVTHLVRACLSAVRSGGRTWVVARTGGRLHRAVAAATERDGVHTVRVTSTDHPSSSARQTGLALYTSRADENALVATLFDHVDYLVAPSHERTNWALGLGIPMFTVGPPVGPFAPLNLDQILEAGVGRPIHTEAQADTLGNTLADLRSDGSLKEMARRGWGRHEIDGFARIAQYLTADLGQGL